MPKFLRELDGFEALIGCFFILILISFAVDTYVDAVVKIRKAENDCVQTTVEAPK